LIASNHASFVSIIFYSGITDGGIVVDQRDRVGRDINAEAGEGNAG